MKKEIYKILIVEDSPTQAMQLRILLEDRAYQVTHAANGNDGIKNARRISPDLIISDVMMPVMDGYEMCRVIKNDKSLRDIPVILLTTLSDVEDLLRGLDVKADCYVTKPYKEHFLLEKIESLLASPLESHEDKSETPIEISMFGKSHTITSTRRQILHILLSLYENAVIQNRELITTREALEDLNQQLHEKLRELGLSEERFKSLVMTIPDIVYRIDSTGHFIFLNAAIRWLGYEPEELIGKHFSEIVSTKDVKNISRDLVLPKYTGKRTGDAKAPKLFDERRTLDRKTTGLEVRLLPKHKKDSSPGYLESLGSEAIDVEVNSSGMYEMHPNSNKSMFIGTVGVIRDISVRKQMQEALKESEERLKIILENVEAGIMVIKPESHRIVDVNPAALKMMAAPREAVIGLQCSQFIRTTQNEADPITDRGQHADKLEATLIKFNGDHLPILKTVANIVLDGKSHLLKSFVDISRLKQAETELKKARDDLEIKVAERTTELKKTQAQFVQSEKIAALGTMTAGIAHELNNPMMGMLNFIQYCRKHTLENDKRYEILCDAERETNRCIDIVKNLLTFSRIEPEGEEEFQPIKLQVIIDRVFSLLSYRIEKENILVDQHIYENTPEVWVKVSGMQQVILNLVSNALDAMKESDRKQIRLDVHSEKGRIHIRIADTGCGIAEKHFSRIFDPFFTTKSPGQGTGLGLSVSQSIVSSHGGEMKCESEVGKGTVFEIVLPVKGIEN